MRFERFCHDHFGRGGEVSEGGARDVEFAEMRAAFEEHVTLTAVCVVLRGGYQRSTSSGSGASCCARRCFARPVSSHWIARLSPRTLAVLEPRFLWPTHRFDGFLVHPESDLFILLDERVVAIRLATASGL